MAELGGPVTTVRNRLKVKKKKRRRSLNLCSRYLCEQLLTPGAEIGFSQEERVQNQSLGRLNIYTI